MTGPIIGQAPGERRIYRNDQSGLKQRDNRIHELEAEVRRLQHQIAMQATASGFRPLKPGTIRRHAFNHGAGRFYVVEGVLLNENAPLDKDEAEELASRPLSKLVGLEWEPGPESLG